MIFFIIQFADTSILQKVDSSSYPIGFHIQDHRLVSISDVAVTDTTIEFTVELQRKAKWYINRVAIMLVLLQFCSWTTYEVPPTTIETLFMRYLEIPIIFLYIMIFVIL